MDAPTPPVSVADEEEEQPVLNDETVAGVYNNYWPSYGVDKPQVWIRLRPPPRYDDNIFEISLDGKNLRLLVQPDDETLRRLKIRKDAEGKANDLEFTTDGILQSSSQEDTYRIIVNEVVDKAMNGVNGAIICLGPEVSGKSFTLFGYFSKFEYRGVIPRALERIFHLIETKSQEVNYTVRIGIIEVRRDKIRDLITLGPYELQHIGENGPYGMLLQQITSADHGLALLVRALSGQKNILREPYARYHTIVYVDVFGETILESEPRTMKSRVTFAKMASMPKRSKTSAPAPVIDVTPFDRFMQADGCIYARPSIAPTRPLFEPPKKYDTCCPPKTGPLGEAIFVRRDLSFLEQMFIKANEFRKLQKYYARLKRLGMTMLMKRPIPAPSQYFRQSKLAHCLQDLVSGRTEIRMILHIRPEQQYLHTALEAMRFVERIICHDPAWEQEQEEANMAMLQNEMAMLRDELEHQAALSKKPSEEMDEAEDAEEAETGLKDKEEVPAVSPIPVVAKPSKRKGRRGSNSKKKKDKDKTGNVTRVHSENLPIGAPLSGENIQGTGQPEDMEVSAEGEEYNLEDNALEMNVNGQRKSLTEVHTNDLATDNVPHPSSAEQKEAWDVFMKTEALDTFHKTKQGLHLYQALIQSENALKSSIYEHDEVLGKVSNLLSRLNQVQADLDIILQEQRLKRDENDQLANVITPVPTKEKEVLRDIKVLQFNCDELLERMKNLRMQIHAQKRIVEIGKAECDTAFQQFCVEHHAHIFGKDDTNNQSNPDGTNSGQPTMGLASLMLQNEEEAAKHFNELKRLAKQQARQFLKFSPKRPAWTPY